MCAFFGWPHRQTQPLASAGGCGQCTPSCGASGQSLTSAMIAGLGWRRWGGGGCCCGRCRFDHIVCILLTVFVIHHVLIIILFLLFGFRILLGFRIIVGYFIFTVVVVTIWRGWVEFLLGRDVSIWIGCRIAGVFDQGFQITANGNSITWKKV